MLVDVSPDMAMYKLLTRQGYEPSFALAEFVDNAIDAYVKHLAKSKSPNSKLEITIKFFSESFHETALRNSIIIEDNGPGIDEARLGDSLKPAKVAAIGGLGEYGIGMKAASVWFADKWTLMTVPEKGDSKFDAQFDLEKLLTQGKSQIEVKKTARRGATSGTSIRLFNLRRAITKDRYATIRQDLREIYQRFTEGAQARVSLIAEFDGTISDLSYGVPSDRKVLFAERYEMKNNKLFLVGKKREWTQPVSFVFEGKTVNGFLALLETGSYKTNPGIVLFRNDRVILGTVRAPYIPADLVGTSNKYARQRIYGELNMDGLPVTYTKDRFEIDEAAFVTSLRNQDGVEDLIKQSEKYRTTLKLGSWAKVSAQSFLKNQSQPATKRAATKTKADGRPQDGTKPRSARGEPSEKPVSKPAAPPDLASFLTTLQTGSDSLALKSVIDETIFQYRRHRPIATALCLRIVLEAGLLEKIRIAFPANYMDVSEMGIAKLVVYIQKNIDTFMDRKKAYKAIKCIQSNAIRGQGDVMLINNVSHGHYSPAMQEVEKFITNLEPLLLWAYSKGT